MDAMDLTATIPDEPLSAVLPEGWTPLTDQLFEYRAADGAIAWDLDRQERTAGRRSAVYTAADLELQVTQTACTDYGAMVCRQVLTNTAAAAVTLSRLQPLHLTWSAGDEPVYIRTVGGGLNQRSYPPETFRVETVRGDSRADVWMENGWDGRSSGGKLPLMTVCCGDGAVTAGLEWSGLWWMDAQAEAGAACRLSCHIPVDGMVLEPGESLELPAAHYVFSSGGLEDASPAIRRYLRDCIVPPCGGRPFRPQVTYNHWFGLGPDIDEALLRRQFARAAKLGVRYAVVDAGWYGGCINGDFGTGVGNWDLVDEAKFPDGFEPVAQAARDHGLKLGLWLEVERAHRQSRWVREHPECFIDIGGDYLHIDLSRPAAVDTCVAVVQKAIDAWGVEWIKLDYNIGPRPFWEKADPTGKIQFAYVRGLYRFYDPPAGGQPVAGHRELRLRRAAHRPRHAGPHAHPEPDRPASLGRRPRGRRIRRAGPVPGARAGLCGLSAPGGPPHTAPQGLAGRRDVPSEPPAAGDRRGRPPHGPVADGRRAALRLGARHVPGPGVRGGGPSRGRRASCRGRIKSVAQGGGIT